MAISLFCSLLFASLPHEAGEVLGCDPAAALSFSELHERKKPPHVGVDSVPYRFYKGPPVNARPKCPLPQDYVRSQGFDRVFGLRAIEKVSGGPGAVTVPVTAAQLHGFRNDGSEYRRENVYCRGPSSF